MCVCFCNGGRSQGFKFGFSTTHLESQQTAQGAELSYIMMISFWGMAASNVLSLCSMPAFRSWLIRSHFLKIAAGLRHRDIPCPKTVAGGKKEEVKLFLQPSQDKYNINCSSLRHKAKFHFINRHYSTKPFSNTLPTTFIPCSKNFTPLQRL